MSLRDSWPLRTPPDLGDGKRLVASVLIWRDFTAGAATACPIYLNRTRLAGIDPETFARTLVSTVRRYDAARIRPSTTRTTCCG
ncbi:MAG: hypothetical protein ACRDQX_09415 [Pseudonocardiaceae bacterium]